MPGRTLPRRALRRAGRVPLAAARRAALALLRTLVRRRPAPPPAGRPRVRILLRHAYGTGGTIRTVLATAGHLARDHDVEIVSLLKEKDAPFFPLPPGVAVSFADDRTVPPGRAARLLGRLPSLLFSVGGNRATRETLWTDLRVARLLLAGNADVLVGTRPALNLLAAEIAPPGAVTIGQDHMNLRAYPPAMRAAIRRAYPRLTALAVLTEAARAEYAAALAGTAVRIVRIPNALATPPGAPSRRTAKVVLAAGRLTRQKGFDLLLRAYEPLSAEHPDWTLRIFGSGPHRARLARRIAARGLTGRVELNPRTADLPGEMERAAVYVLSSRFEGMPMVVLEAMSKGLPVVAFDCPTGPAEMISHESDGLIVPPKDVAGLTAALRRLMTDGDLRDELGERARASVRAYDPEWIVPRWTDLIDELLAPRRRRPVTRPVPGPSR
ncbi:GalNAc-alpha-(1-_4)-GalNAc-alpha-(1-_3)-diNAcBac-PP-undecaprenol alpha-1,4-N-acetyl-D-galactosaminyltransferase [Actinomadura rubteroloni]|uniref:GalNAc-alpha-(1->4)-GalNAc-alpha-(1->3)-diNAcBac-PP-undecaprenol alpha-1,4-N-acetyl-D-galactosaminyltransferase n=1 Tax=Actinomadura rubteroloni TaxID=1926885 RepID=A0A2P4UBJ5_9ACTN|nr:glycosyltransferase family 4 protein [Actinomadura rubteroloni]POM22402.1 GalNAc-alpha-(1->4)-GalNAc-alpha-(1->3)-diNAcBac-PP-undecaprenol alpha-1,4-N-acetyl-D-galactosaminyltransferase [Actinomadura rubteroloni]